MGLLGLWLNSTGLFGFGLLCLRLIDFRLIGWSADDLGLDGLNDLDLGRCGLFSLPLDLFHRLFGCLLFSLCLGCVFNLFGPCTGLAAAHNDVLVVGRLCQTLAQLFGLFRGQGCRGVLGVDASFAGGIDCGLVVHLQLVRKLLYLNFLFFHASSSPRAVLPV